MAEPSGEHVVRGGKTGGITGKYNYSATKDGAVAGWDSVDANAGEVGMTGEGGDHFSAAMGKGNAGASAPGDQT
jgi:hypothetical protein